jgi:hypothetical protein
VASDAVAERLGVVVVVAAAWAVGAGVGPADIVVGTAASADTADIAAAAAVAAVGTGTDGEPRRAAGGGRSRLPFLLHGEARHFYCGRSLLLCFGAEECRRGSVMMTAGVVLIAA